MNYSDQTICVGKSTCGGCWPECHAYKGGEIIAPGVELITLRNEDGKPIDTDRRAHDRLATTAHCMVKIGLNGESYGLGTVHEISPSGFLLAYEREQIGSIAGAIGHPCIIICTENWNRHFSMCGSIVRITYKAHIACSISSVSSTMFLIEWIRKELGQHRRGQ